MYIQWLKKLPKYLHVFERLIWCGIGMKAKALNRSFKTRYVSCDIFYSLIPGMASIFPDNCLYPSRHAFYKVLADL